MTATLLRCARGLTLRKTKDADGTTTKGYDQAKHFTARPVKWDGVVDIYKTLQALQGDERACLIRGQLKEGVDPDHVTRTNQGDDACFDDVARPWLALDIDGADLPESLWGAEAEDIADWLCAKYVPRELVEVSCVVQWSASHGWDRKRVFARLWYWLTKPVATAALRAQVGQWRDDHLELRALDPSLVRAVQVHYTAAPLCLGEDPVGQRLIAYEGVDEAADLSAAQAAWEATTDKRAKRLARSCPVDKADWDVKCALGALEAISPDCDYDVWLSVGMALHSRWPGDDGVGLWDDWSARGAKYEDGICDRKWSSFRGGGINLGSLFAEASKGGWKHPGQDPAKAGDRTPAQVTEPDPWTPGDVPARLDAAPLRKLFDGDKAAASKPEENLVLEVSAGKTTYRFGHWVVKETSSDNEGNGEVQTRKLASGVWPLALVQDVDTGERGVLFQFETASGQKRQGVIGGEAWVDKSPARTSAVRMAGEGVAIEPYQGVATVMAIGTWACDPSIPRRDSVSGWGWRRGPEGQWVYTAGEETYGADWAWSGPRAQRSAPGDLAAWRAEVAQLVANCPAMILALSVSLAGALVEPLGQGSFLLHLWGGSSTGKTLATLMALSVWDDPTQPRSWKDTGNYLLQSLPQYSGRALVIDDLRKAGRVKAVGEMVLALSDNQTKGRLDRQGRIRRTSRFALTGLSSGEQSMAAFLASEGTGDIGHQVRAIDFEVRLGDSTKSAEHAKEIERWLARCPWGHAGRAFAKTLQQELGLDGMQEHLRQMTQRYVDGVRHHLNAVSTERIAHNLALGAVALDLAQFWGIVPDLGLDPMAMMEWAVGRLKVERGRETSPEERALSELLDRVERLPGLYPTLEDWADSRTPTPRELAGVHDQDGGRLYLLESWIKPLCSDMRVQPRSFLRWLQNQGYASQGTSKHALPGTSRPRYRWRVIDLSAAKEGGGS